MSLPQLSLTFHIRIINFRMIRLLTLGHNVQRQWNNKNNINDGMGNVMHKLKLIVPRNTNLSTINKF